MYLLFSIGYSILGVSALLWMMSGNSQRIESLYSPSLKSEPRGQEICPQGQDLTSGIWSLDFPAIKEQLPDLRSELICLGCNQRPDAGAYKFILKCASSEESRSVAPYEKIYLQVESSREGRKYQFSQENRPTELWLECRPTKVGNHSLEVKVRLQGLNQEIVTTPKERETLVLSAPGFSVEPWQIGGIRVDASFPVKQKIRRIGHDKFLLLHGGSDYADKARKERVDFVAANEENYSRYLGVGDILLWDGVYWQSCGDFQGDSTQVPLLEVKKVDDKAMVIELWNVGGTAHQSMSLVKAMSSPIEIAEIAKEFEFIGMRSWTRPIIQAGGQRLILSPDDWVVYTGQSWEKVVSKEQLDRYLTGRTQGPLFVFDKIEKDTRGFVVRAHVFNAHKTLVEDVTLPLKQMFDLPSQSVPASKEEKQPYITRQVLVNSEGANTGGA